MTKNKNDDALLAENIQANLVSLIEGLSSDADKRDEDTATIIGLLTLIESHLAPVVDEDDSDPQLPNTSGIRINPALAAEAKEASDWFKEMRQVMAVWPAAPHPGMIDWTEANQERIAAMFQEETQEQDREQEEADFQAALKQLKDDLFVGSSYVSSADDGLFWIVNGRMERADLEGIARRYMCRRGVKLRDGEEYNSVLVASKDLMSVEVRRDDSSKAVTVIVKRDDEAIDGGIYMASETEMGVTIKTDAQGHSTRL